MAAGCPFDGRPPPGEPHARGLQVGGHGRLDLRPVGYPRFDVDRQPLAVVGVEPEPREGVALPAALVRDEHPADRVGSRPGDGQRDHVAVGGPRAEGQRGHLLVGAVDPRAGVRHPVLPEHARVHELERARLVGLQEVEPQGVVPARLEGHLRGQLVEGAAGDDRRRQDAAPDEGRVGRAGFGRGRGGGAVGVLKDRVERVPVEEPVLEPWLHVGVAEVGGGVLEGGIGVARELEVVGRQGLPGLGRRGPRHVGDEDERLAAGPRHAAEEGRGKRRAPPRGRRGPGGREHDGRQKGGERRPDKEQPLHRPDILDRDKPARQVRPERAGEPGNRHDEGHDCDRQGGEGPCGPWPGAEQEREGKQQGSQEGIPELVVGEPVRPPVDRQEVGGKEGADHLHGVGRRRRQVDPVVKGQDREEGHRPQGDEGRPHEGDEDRLAAPGAAQEERGRVDRRCDDRHPERDRGVADPRAREPAGDPEPRPAVVAVPDAPASVQDERHEGDRGEGHVLVAHDRGGPDAGAQ